MSGTARARRPLKQGYFTVPDDPSEPPKLMGTVCKDCGEYFFPKRVVCAKCLSENTAEAMLGPAGTLYSYTFVHFPLFGSTFTVSNLTSFYLNLPLAMGLALLWGYAGILSFGQMAFFGIAGYAYGILAINFGGGALTLPAAVLAVGISVLVAGRLLTQGSPEAVARDARVREVYLGEAAHSQPAAPAQGVEP